MKYPSCAYWYAFCVYKYAHAYLNYVAREYFIFGVGFALSVLRYKAMREPQKVELTKVQSRFFCVPAIIHE